MNSKKKASKKIDSKAFSRLYSYMKEYPKEIAISLCLIPFSILASLLVPIVSIKIIDEHIAVGTYEGLNLLISIYLGIFVLGYLADSIYSYFMQFTGNRALTKMSFHLFKHVLKLPQAYFDRSSNGVTLARLTTDFEIIGETLSMGIVNLLVDLLKICVLFIFLFTISAYLGTVFLIFLPVFFLVMQLIRRKLRRYYDLSRQSQAESIAFLSECLQGMKTILLLRKTQYSYDKYRDYNNKYLKNKKSENIYEALLFSITEGISLLIIIVVLLFGSKLTISSALSIGSLIIFMQVLQKIFLPIRELTQQFTTIQRAVSSLNAVERLFSEGTDHEITAKKLDEKPQFKSLEFKNVSFRYNDNQPLVLDDISFSLKKNEQIAFVGKTGSGKSTIIKLLTKKYQHYSGEILLNGRELRTYNRAELLNLFNIMNQDVFLFNESVGFNIKLAAGYNEDKAVLQAISNLSADKFINELPGKLDYMVFENGKNLSNGQQQLVGLIRAYNKGNDVFILDEATASIDSITENIIEKALSKIFSEKTVIAIAHRLSTIQNSTMIYVMREGKIIERGDHQSLLNLQGVYHKLATTTNQLPAERVG